MNGDAASAVTPRDHFDPEAWARVYDPSAPVSGSVALRNVTNEAARVAASLYGPGHQWLDVGCGTGHVVAHWNRQGREMLGVDHDPNMLKFARQHEAQPHWPPVFIAASVYQLPWRAMSFDGLLASLLTGCLAHPEQFLAEVGRVLRPGGCAVLTFTSERSLAIRAIQLLRRAGLLPSANAVTGSGFRRYRLSDVQAMLGKAGLAVEKQMFINGVPVWLQPLLPTRWRERLCRHFILVVRRR